MKFSPVAEIFFPLRCPGCDGLPEKGFPVCQSCKDLIIHPAPSKSRCDICFLTLQECICSKRQFYDKFSASFIYDGAPKNTVFKLKFRARPDLAKSYANLLYYSLNERDMLEETDAITFVPMSRYSRFKRGYNQSALLAKYLSKLSEKPCIPFLIKSAVTDSQHTLNKNMRSGNLLGVFEPDPKYLKDIENKTILIVDDVSTTGATLNEIAKTLLIFGAKEVFVAACTVTKKQKDIEY